MYLPVNRLGAGLLAVSITKQTRGRTGLLSKHRSDIVVCLYIPASSCESQVRSISVCEEAGF